MSTAANPLTSDPKREPLFTQATYVAGATALVTVLAALGIHLAPGVQDFVVQAWPVVAILVPFATALAARRHVTPVADPRDADGNPLVSAAPADPAA